MRRLFPVRPATLALVAAVAFPMAVQAQQGADEEWTVYGGGPGHTRYSSLDQIDASNVAELEVAWRWTGLNFGPNPFAGNQTTPLMIDGMLYATVGMRRAVVAIDPATGETIWTWTMDEGERLSSAPRANSGRGVSYWTDGAGEIVAVGNGGTIVRYDGTVWSTMSSTTAHDLYDISGTAADDLFACGNAGVLLYYDGQGWGPINNDSAGYCTGVYALNDAVYFVGVSGKTLTLFR